MGGVATPFGYFAGPLLFDGSVDAPRLKTGSFDATYINEDSIYNGSRGSIVIGLDTSSAPEPAAWTLMITGFGLVGAAIRTRRQRVAVAYR